MHDGGNNVRGMVVWPYIIDTTREFCLHCYLYCQACRLIYRIKVLNNMIALCCSPIIPCCSRIPQFRRMEQPKSDGLQQELIGEPTDTQGGGQGRLIIGKPSLGG